MSIVQQLEQRLRAGELRIEAENDLNRRAELEKYWLELLRRYEDAVDAVRAHDERKTA